MIRYGISFLSLWWIIGKVAAQEVIVTSSQEGLVGDVNSEYFESHPVISPNGTKIFFSRSNHPDNLGGRSDEGDIWSAQLSESGAWVVLGNEGITINNQEQNSIIGFLNEGEAALLNRQYGAANKGFAISSRKDDSWGKPRDVNIPYFASQSEYQSASISPDGRVMVFSIMSFGSYGVEDLYFTRLRPDGTWSDLRNLGPTVNTRYQEMTPFVSPDGETIYFASNGHGGEGGLDIFYSKRLDDTWRNWSTPVNLGPMVNTVGSESSFSFQPAGDWAVLVSTQNSDGYGDLKKVSIEFPEDYVVQEDSVTDHPLLAVVSEDSLANAPEPAVTFSFSGRVRNLKDKSPINAVLFLTGDTDSLSIKSASATGFKVTLDPGQYRMRVTSPDFLEYDTTLVIDEQSTIVKDYYLHPLEVGSTITLNHVLFARGTTNLLPGSEQDLEAVYRMLKENPTIVIEVTGHTDNQGNFKLNVKLSQDRVDKVVSYLVQKGIRKSRISGKGWGPMKPVASNNSEETRRLNRRVEFTIVKK